MAEESLVAAAPCASAIILLGFDICACASHPWTNPAHRISLTKLRLGYHALQIQTCVVNFADVNVQIFADTSSQSIQMVSQIFLSFLFIFLFSFFFGYFLGWSVGEEVRKRGLWTRSVGGSTDQGSVFSGHPVFYASVLLLKINFVIILSKCFRSKLTQFIINKRTDA